MKEILRMDNWSGLEFNANNLSGLLREGKRAVYDFPRTIDVRNYDVISLEVEVTGITDLWLEAKLIPLCIARPEFIAETSASLLIPPVRCSHIEIPFSIFHYRHMADAHLKYISSIELLFRSGSEGEDKAICIREIAFSKAGDFHAYAEVASAAGEADEEVHYRITLENEKDAIRYVSIGKEWYGKEIIPFAFPKKIILAPMEKQTLIIKAYIQKAIPIGGWEQHMVEFIPDGDGSKKQRVELYAARKGEHPFILHKEKEWNRLKKHLSKDKKMKSHFIETYEKTANEWEVPLPHSGKEYVYPSVSQENFLNTVIAWKVTEHVDYEKKILDYIKGFLDEQLGYFSTAYSYFVFIELPEEYAKGDFKVHRACSAGWVQEAEFMAKIAIAYDLLYDNPALTPTMHMEMEKCMRSYMDFTSWRLTDGDGNNFQIAEASAALYCAFMLQDYPMIHRFLDGKNGLKDLIASVFSDDGSYFEGASGYMRLTAELFLRACMACENFGINLKDEIIPAAYDTPVIHSPWALKPFLGMSFDKTMPSCVPIRRLKSYFDNLLLLLSPKGILFSAGDSNEQNFIAVMEMAYYLYRDARYLEVTKLARHHDLLYGIHMIETEEFVLGKTSCLNTGNGFAVLRDCPKHDKETVTQAVLKFGQHGGYHGHYDRLSLLSFMRNNQTFHNMEYAWYGYDSFLFKMWVQTSIAHNMVVVDGRMQEPTACKCIYFEDQDEFHAVCAQTISRWSDPPYGGQTPYPMRFPEEKCRQEGRFLLSADVPRKQGEIGEYSDPVFQRRLVVLAESCCFIWDYEEADEVHTYDCLYHSMGKVEVNNLVLKEKTKYFDRNPYGAGQFIRDCHWYDPCGTVKLVFKNDQKRVNHNDIIDFVSNAELYRLYPDCGTVMIGRYPKKQDIFTEEEAVQLENIMQESCKKTISFRHKGKSAKFITALEIGSCEGMISEISCESYEKIVIKKKDGNVRELCVRGMDCRGNEDIKVSYH